MASNPSRGVQTTTKGMSERRATPWNISSHEIRLTIIIFKNCPTAILAVFQ